MVRISDCKEEDRRGVGKQHYLAPHDASMFLSVAFKNIDALQGGDMSL